MVRAALATTLPVAPACMQSSRFSSITVPVSAPPAKPQIKGHGDLQIGTAARGCAACIPLYMSPWAQTARSPEGEGSETSHADQLFFQPVPVITWASESLKDGMHRAKSEVQAITRQKLYLKQPHQWHTLTQDISWVKHGLRNQYYVSQT